MHSQIACKCMHRHATRAARVSKRREVLLVETDRHLRVRLARKHAEHTPLLLPHDYNSVVAARFAIDLSWDGTKAFF